MEKLYDSCQKYESRYIWDLKVITSLIKGLMRKAGSRAAEVLALARGGLKLDGAVRDSCREEYLFDTGFD